MAVKIRVLLLQVPLWKNIKLLSKRWWWVAFWSWLYCSSFLQCVCVCTGFQNIIWTFTGAKGWTEQTQPPMVLCKVKVGIYTQCIHIFARLVPLCMLSRCLLNKNFASELSPKFTKTALLVGNAELLLGDFGGSAPHVAVPGCFPAWQDHVVRKHIVTQVSAGTGIHNQGQHECCWLQGEHFLQDWMLKQKKNLFNKADQR